MNTNMIEFSKMDSLGPEIATNLGWKPHEQRTDEEHETHDKLVAAMPTFMISRGPDESGFDGDKACLWDFWRKLLGKDVPTSHQAIGSCVGHGKQNAERALSAADIVYRGDGEMFVTIFEPYGYGRSRFHAGIRGKGSGSTGSGAAKAARVDGVLTAEMDGLSGWEIRGNTIYWSESVDYNWSDGSKIDAKWLDVGRKHLVRTTSPVRSAADVKAALQAGFSVTIASNWGGSMRPPVKEGVLLNRRSGTWMHQMSVIGWMLHQSLGDLYYIWNSWAEDAHGKCPTGAPPGGFWVQTRDMDDITSQDDSYVYSQYDGYPDNRPYQTLMI